MWRGSLRWHCPQPTGTLALARQDSMTGRQAVSMKTMHPNMAALTRVNLPVSVSCVGTRSVTVTYASIFRRIYSVPGRIYPPKLVVSAERENAGIGSCISFHLVKIPFSGPSSGAVRYYALVMGTEPRSLHPAERAARPMHQAGSLFFNT